MTVIDQDPCQQGASLPAHHAIDQQLPAQVRACGGFDMEVLSGLVPLAVVAQAVAECGRAERRVRALPAVLVVYFVIGLALFSGQGYREVLRKITVHLRAGAGGYRIATSSALSRARRRLGPEPLERLFGWSCRSMSGPQPPQAYAFGRLLTAMDGTILDVPDTAANAATFGDPPSAGGYRGGGQGGYPQVRLLALVTCGTRTIIDAAFGPRKISEHELARTIARRGRIGPGMIVLADRNFGGYPLVSQFFKLGAELIWRVREDRILPRLAEFADGSYLSVITEPQDGKRRAMARHRGRPLATVPQGIPVRVIEADITIASADGPPRTEFYRLIATLYNTRQAPALQIARTYARRWEIEGSYRELKTFLRGRQPVLRSAAPDGITQEIYALLTAHQLVQATRAEAAASRQATRLRGTPLDPARVSYTVTLHAITRQITHGTPGRPRSRRTLLGEILDDLLPVRRQRSYPRGHKSSNARKAAIKTSPPGPVTCTITIRQPSPDPTTDP
jgi:hypothetical protein